MIKISFSDYERNKHFIHFLFCLPCLNRISIHFHIYFSLKHSSDYCWFDCAWTSVQRRKNAMGNWYWKENWWFREFVWQEKMSEMALNSNDNENEPIKTTQKTGHLHLGSARKIVLFRLGFYQQISTKISLESSFCHLNYLMKLGTESERRNCLHTSEWLRQQFINYLNYNLPLLLAMFSLSNSHITHNDNS